MMPFPRSNCFLVAVFMLLAPQTLGFSSVRTSPQTRLPSSSSTSSSRSKLCAIKTGGTRKADYNSPASSSSSSSSPRWQQKVEAKRPVLGHVVPEASSTRQRRKVRPQGEYLADGNNNYSRNPSPRTPPLKILGGNFRGRKLISPIVHLRPMMGKVREACFSTFTYFGLYKPPTSAANKALCRHLDIFSGSGSVGLESLSRGATHCTFVDLAPNCCETVQQNLEMCRIPIVTSSTTRTKSDDPGQTAAVVCADALEMLKDPVAALQKSGIPCAAVPKMESTTNAAANMLEGFDNPLLLPYQIVTLCPPYEEIVYGDLIDAVCNSPLVTDDTVVLIEYPVELGCLPHVYDLRSGGKMIGLRNRRYGRTVVAMYIINPSGKLEGADSRPEEFVSL